MSRYVDGYVLPVAKERLEAYRDSASEAGKSWIKHGALQYVECFGDDLDPDMEVEITTFPNLVETSPGETVIFAFVVFSSKEHRDEVNAAVMAEMEEYADGDEMEMPFDVARMAYGGFEALVDYEPDSTGREPIEPAG